MRGLVRLRGQLRGSSIEGRCWGSENRREVRGWCRPNFAPSRPREARIFTRISAAGTSWCLNPSSSHARLAWPRRGREPSRGCTNQSATRRRPLGPRERTGGARALPALGTPCNERTAPPGAIPPQDDVLPPHLEPEGWRGPEARRAARPEPGRREAARQHEADRLCLACQGHCAKRAMS